MLLAITKDAVDAEPFPSGGSGHGLVLKIRLQFAQENNNFAQRIDNLIGLLLSRLP